MSNTWNDGKLLSHVLEILFQWSSAATEFASAATEFAYLQILRMIHFVD